MTVKMPHQCFINGQFTDADDGKTYDTINPTDGSVSPQWCVQEPAAWGSAPTELHSRQPETALHPATLPPPGTSPRMLPVFLSAIQL